MRVETTVAFTGYRPYKLPWGANELDPRCVALKKRLREEIESAYARGYTTFITGMAQGVDTYAAEEVIALKRERGGVGVVCAIPYAGFPTRFNKEQRERFNGIVLEAERCFVCSLQYSRTCMAQRNRFMVDNSSLLIAVYDGQSGGTHNTVEYARERGRETRIILP